MITVRFGENTLCVTGHAGYAPAGGDIVCAAASMLCYALAEALRREGMPQAAEVTVRQARMEIRAHPEHAQQAWCGGLFAMARAGFALLAAQYPGCVQILSGERSFHTSESENRPESGQKEERT